MRLTSGQLPRPNRRAAGGGDGGGAMALLAGVDNETRRPDFPAHRQPPYPARALGHLRIEVLLVERRLIDRAGGYPGFGFRLGRGPPTSCGTTGAGRRRLPGQRRLAPGTSRLISCSAVMGAVRRSPPAICYVSWDGRLQYGSSLHGTQSLPRITEFRRCGSGDIRTVDAASRAVQAEREPECGFDACSAGKHAAKATPAPAAGATRWPNTERDCSAVGAGRSRRGCVPARLAVRLPARAPATAITALTAHPRTEAGRWVSELCALPRSVSVIALARGSPYWVS